MHVVELLLHLHLHVLLDRSGLSVNRLRANKVHRVNSQVTAGLRRPVRTHAAYISILIALRPSLGSVRCCDHSLKITFLALGRRSTSGTS